jgi:hypothetical protein
VVADLRSRGCFCALKQLNEEGAGRVAGKQILGVMAGIAIWAVYFYTIDFALMQAQGLPVAATLLPK